MKTAIRLVPFVLLAGLALLWRVAWARPQDPLRVAPDVYRVLLSNPQVRVFDVRLKPKATAPMHSHPAHVVYALSDGQVRFTLADGETQDVTLRAGEATWSDEMRHAVENISTTEARVLVVELKQAPRKLEPYAASESHREHVMLAVADLEWRDAPPSLPRGAKMAVLLGDPTKPGPFTMRIRVPAGYKVPPHWHPADEHVTVLSGAFSMGTGDEFDTTQSQRLAAGSFAVMPAGMHHFAWTEEDSVVQVHGIGPWAINYLSPADDPRTGVGEEAARK